MIAWLADYQRKPGNPGWHRPRSGVGFAGIMELEIIQLIMQSPGTMFSCKEVGKMVDRPTFRENPSWARHTLDKLVSEGKIWKEHSYYFYPTDEQKEKQPRPKKS